MLNSIDQDVQSVFHHEKGEAKTRVVEFVDKQLRSSAGFSVVQEYPSLFGDYPGGESLIIRLNERIASHVGMVARDFSHPKFRLKIGLVGSVATATEFRNRGLASQLLTRSAQELKRRGCVISMLWTDNPDFYVPLGFHRVGQEVDFRFSRRAILVAPPKPTEFDPRKHTNALWRLYQKHEVKLDRSLEEQRKLCLVPRSRIYVTEREGALTSYLVANKGDDFDGYIHEWGGDLAELAKNIASVQYHVYGERDLSLIAPASYDLTPIRRLAVLEWEGVLGMIKLLDRNYLLEIYGNYLKSIGVSFSAGREKQTFRIGPKDFPLKSDADYLRLIFGEGNLQPHPVLPLFLWGYDSI